MEVKILVFCLLLCVGVNSWTPEERHEAQKQILNECKESTEASDEDVENILGRKVPQNHNAKCLLACGLEKLKIIVDGKLSNDGVKSFGEQEHEGNEKNIGIFNMMASECEDIDDPDKCELSSKFLNCKNKAAAKLNLSIEV